MSCCLLLVLVILVVAPLAHHLTPFSVVAGVLLVLVLVSSLVWARQLQPISLSSSCNIFPKMISFLLSSQFLVSSTFLPFSQLSTFDLLDNRNRTQKWDESPC